MHRFLLFFLLLFAATSCRHSGSPVSEVVAKASSRAFSKSNAKPKSVSRAAGRPSANAGQKSGKNISSGAAGHSAAAASSVSARAGVSSPVSGAVAFQARQNREALASVSSSVLCSSKREKLLSEMQQNPRLAALIRRDPLGSTKKWLLTRNHVDGSLIAKTPKGRRPINASTYAGNTFFFDPALNSRLDNALSSRGRYCGLSARQFEELNKKYPDGVAYSKRGFPDFTPYAICFPNGKPAIIDVGRLSPRGSNDDRIKAGNIFLSHGGKYTHRITWHHIEYTTKLVAVPVDLHCACKHTGGRAMAGLRE